MMGIETGVIFGLITLFGWGISKITLKPAVDRLGPYYSLFYNYIFVALSLILFSIFRVQLVVPSKRIMIYLISAIAIGASSIYFFFNAINKGKVSIVSPISHSATIITVALSFIFYKEMLDSIQMISVGLLIAGVLLLSFRYSDFKKLKFSKKLIPGAEFALLTMLGWGIYFFIIKPIVVELGPLPAILYLETGITILISIPVLWKGAKKPGKSLLYCAISGVLIAIASFSYNLGIEKAAVSLVFPIANSSILVTAIGSHIFLKERVEPSQMAGIIVVLLGLIMISL